MNFIFSCNKCSCTTFIFTSYILHIQAMLILILIDVKRNNLTDNKANDGEKESKLVYLKFKIFILINI